MSSVSTDDIFTPSEHVRPALGGRPTTAVVGGVPIAITCPAWCTTDHASEDVVFLDDLSHWGQPISLLVPRFSGGADRVMVAGLSQYPFAARAEERRVFVSLTADGGEAVELGREGVQWLVAAERAHADQLLTLAAQL